MKRRGGYHPRLGGARGFTLTEFIVVAAVLGILLSVAGLTMWNSASSFRFSSAVNRVVADIRYAQQQARTHNGWYGITFSTGANTYHVYATDGTTDTDVASPANLAESLSIDLSADYGVTIQSVDFGGGSKVEFNSLGTPYLDRNGSALAGTGSVVLASDGETRTIQVFRATGKVHLP